MVLNRDYLGLQGPSWLGLGLQGPGWLGLGLNLASLGGSILVPQFFGNSGTKSITTYVNSEESD